MVNYISGNPELIKIVEAVATEKGISVDSVIDALEQGIKLAARKKYGVEYDINAQINRKTGGFKIYRRLEVVEEVEDSNVQISIETVKKSPSGQDAKLGDHVIQDLPPVDLKRLVASVVKQVIVQKVKVAEKEKEFNLFEGKVGTIVNGIVKKVSPKGVLLDVSGAEAFLDNSDSIPHENLSQNDRVKASIKEVVRKDNGVQVYLSRTSSKFMESLFMQEVPEIYDGIINIKAIAREPGARAKVAVRSVESNLDPVGACVGVRGSRVQVVINELKGEKIDIIEWSEDTATFVVNALTPASVLKVVIDEENNKIETVVPEKDFSIAIGRKGQNARLASKLTGWSIDILTEEQESKIRKEESEKVYDVFVNHLDMDDMLARLLIAEGISEVEEICMIDVEELATIETLDLDRAKIIHKKACDFVKTDNYKKIKWDRYNLDDSLLEVKNLTAEIAISLKARKVVTVTDVADLSRDDFKDIVSDSIDCSDKEVDEIIMDARDVVNSLEVKES
ncbi:MAG: transcription termination/antitermination protein NusA [Alphaproteobacteria bacterium]|nr:transcription termination/antitermination protein NusA [Alphaproteobacteria bacterium]